MYIPYYIHLNALDYTMPEWRVGEVTDIETALRTLESYRWSSHLDYLGIKNFPSLIDKTEMTPLLGSRESYEQSIAEIIMDPVRASNAEELEFPKP